MTSVPGTPDEPTGALNPLSAEPTRPLASRPKELAAMHDFTAAIRVGGAIGPYRVLERIGEGGFGEVWLAERREPMVQRVAIKVIKPGMDSRAVVARFEQERQALAVMSHPNVARVLDGGIGPRERPYFVMEFVKGDPITTFCDKQRLTIRERLQLFIPVCEALQHAHMKGIIHRDIKPSNILVAPGEGTAPPSVKVIDFGVAKAMSGPLTGATIHTERGQMIGTPEYMSPEQAEMGATDIDTRTDVYSLGVVLYELLSGTLPFDSKTLRTGGYVEMQRILSETDPPKPSARLSSLDDATGLSIAKARQVERERISIELRRELEWIPLMAMRKDRSRRYPSAESLAADVRRYLDGLPLEAAPESRAYLVRKFVRRNRVQVTAAALVAAALVGGLGATLWQARVAAGERDAARLARDAAQLAREAESRRADELAQVGAFQSTMLREISTAAAGLDLMEDVRERFEKALAKDGVAEAERAVQVERLGSMLGRVNATDVAAAMIDRTILQPAVRALDQQFKDQPLIEAQLRTAIADLYYRIALFDDALPLHQAALATHRRMLGDDAPKTIRSVGDVGLTLAAQGKQADAEPFYREALERSRRVLGDDHADTIVAIQNMGFLLQAQGKLVEAEPLYREALERGRRVLGDDATQTLITLSNLAALLRMQNRFAEAEPLAREGLERRRRVFGEDHLETIKAGANLGVLLFSQRKLVEAEPYYREALEKSRRALGEEHPDVLAAASNLGSLLIGMKRLSEAETYLRQVLEARLRVSGQDHPNTLMTVVSLVFLLRSEGRHQEAVDLATRFEESARKTFAGSNRVMLAGLLTSLGRARVGLGHEVERFGLAEANLLEAHAIFVPSFGEKHPNTQGTVEGLVDLYEAWASAEPARGHEERAADWRLKLEAGKTKR